jgi:rhodanese-related sulfurtransferase
MSVRSVPPAEAATAIAAGAVLIDVRTPAEFAGAHAPAARNLPLDRLDPVAVRAMRGTGPLYVICRSGMRSKNACNQLAAAGLDDLVDVDGGMNAWQAAGLPIQGSGRSTFGVDRQVRSIIGGGVLIGAALAILVHPYWVGLSAFFGAGLLMAGLTDLCPLAILVARMPWNRSTGGGPACTVAPGKPV